MFTFSNIFCISPKLPKYIKCTHFCITTHCEIFWSHRIRGSGNAGQPIGRQKCLRYILNKVINEVNINKDKLEGAKENRAYKGILFDPASPHVVPPQEKMSFLKLTLRFF